MKPTTYFNPVEWELVLPTEMPGVSAHEQDVINHLFDNVFVRSKINQSTKYSLRD